MVFPGPSGSQQPANLSGRDGKRDILEGSFEPKVLVTGSKSTNASEVSLGLIGYQRISCITGKVELAIAHFRYQKINVH